MQEIRKITKDDLPHLKIVLSNIELFPPEMLDEMIANYLNSPHSEEIWLTETINDEPISIAFCAPEKLTDGTYNLYAIGVKKEIQEQGAGGRMMTFIENHLKELGKRILIVETSGIEEFEAVRQFYKNLGYRKEAVIQDFWEEGDDKVIFWKKL